VHGPRMSPTASPRPPSARSDHRLCVGGTAADLTLLTRSPPSHRWATLSRLHEDDIAVILYTSGTNRPGPNRRDTDPFRTLSILQCHF